MTNNSTKIEGATDLLDGSETPLHLHQRTTRSDEVPAADRSRRQLALALLGTLGGASILDACAPADGNGGNEKESVAQTAQALAGAGSFGWTDTVLGSGFPANRSGGDLANLVPSTIGGAQVVIAKGCCSVDDGGGGVFVWSTSGTDDGGTFIAPPTAPAGSGWRRVYSGPLSVKWFGARGRGASDDTLAIQTAITVMLSNTLTTFPNGDTLYFPKGVYNISTQLLWSGGYGSRIVGAGRGQTKLRWAGATLSAPTAMLKILNCSECSVENISFDCQNPAADVGVRCARGIFITSDGGAATPIGPTYNTIRGCMISYATDVGIQIGSGSNVDVNLDNDSIVDCHISWCGTGIRIADTSQDQTSIENVGIENSIVAGIEVTQYAHAVRIGNCNFSGNGTAHVLVRKEFFGHVSLRDMYLELQNPLLYAEQAIGTQQGTIEIRNVFATVNPGYTIPRIIDYQQNGCLVIDNCVFGGNGPTSAIYVHPDNGAHPVGGLRLFKTAAVHLFNGAVFDVATTAVYGTVRWIDLGSTTRATSSAIVDTIDVSLGNRILLNRPQASGGGGAVLQVGSGVPSFAAEKGSIYVNLDGGADTTLWFKQSGSATTGWRRANSPALLDLQTSASAFSPATLADGQVATAVVSVPGANPNGDKAMAQMDTLSAPGWILSAVVSATGTVTVTLFNKTGATRSVGGTLWVSVWPRYTLLPT